MRTRRTRSSTIVTSSSSTAPSINPTSEEQALSAFNTYVTESFVPSIVNPMLEQIGTLQKQLESEQEKLNKASSDYQAQLQRLTEEKQQIEEEYNKNKASVTNSKWLEQQINRYKADKIEVKDAHDKAAKLLQTNITTLEAQLDELRTVQKGVDIELHRVRATNISLDQANKELAKKVSAQAHVIQAQDNRFKEYKTNSEKAAADKDAEIAELKRRNQELEAQTQQLMISRDELLADKAKRKHHEIEGITAIQRPVPRLTPSMFSPQQQPMHHQSLQYSQLPLLPLISPNNPNAQSYQTGTFPTQLSATPQTLFYQQFMQQQISTPLPFSTAHVARTYGMNGNNQK